MSLVSVRTKSGAFRRAGFAFTEDPREINIHDLTDEQVAALENEPMLVVVAVTALPTPPPAPPADGADKDEAVDQPVNPPAQGKGKRKDK